LGQWYFFYRRKEIKDTIFLNVNVINLSLALMAQYGIKHTFPMPNLRTLITITHWSISQLIAERDDWMTGCGKFAPDDRRTLCTCMYDVFIFFSPSFFLFISKCGSGPHLYCTVKRVRVGVARAWHHGVSSPGLQHDLLLTKPCPRGVPG